MTEPTTVTHNRAAAQWELFEGDVRVGVASYDLRDDVYAIMHTTIDPRREGRGLGSILVKAALEEIRDENAQVLPMCPFVPRVLHDNPELISLVPEDQRHRYGL